MKPILPTLIVFALLVGIAGCSLPSQAQREWRWRDDRPGERYAQGGRDHSGRDCSSAGQPNCRDGD